MDVRSSESGSPLGPLALPAHPPASAPAAFPLLASVAPVAGAVVLWMITGSAISLAFAALGPIVAVASVLDARRQARRAARRARAERDGELERLRLAIIERHDAERRAAWHRSPSARTLIDDELFDWRDGAPGHVVLGRGTAPSSLRVDGTPVDEVDREMLEQAARLEDAPVLGAVANGVGVVGPAPLARAVARGLLTQVAHRCRPGAVEIAVPEGAGWAWARILPHRGGGGDRMVRVVDTTDAPTDAPRSRPVVPGRAQAHPHRGAAASVDPESGAIIAVSNAVAGLPPGLETVITVEGPAGAVVERRGSEGRRIVPDLLGESEAANWAVRMRAAAARERLGSAASATLPDRVAFATLVQPVTAPDSRASLRVAVGANAGGQCEIDLVTGGPHAIVAGTTGSGKSEFLLAWLAALARCHPPTRVAFLLVDFKGGAAFEPIRDLPHVTGIVTDLDEAEAERAVLSLRAELRHRESVLRVERARDIVELDPDVELARLVIVVDEYQALMERFPDLGAVIADIAARGRSLGVHLILASQRPNGVVREQVTTNCPIRVSLRVMQRADSIAVVGTDAASTIRSDTPGRGIADAGDGCPVAFQSAMADDSALAEVRRLNAGLPRARRPWVDPLPTRVSAQELEAFETSRRPSHDGYGLGLVDEPESQRRGLAAWSPADDGHLLVAGSPGAGRTTALAAVAWAVARRFERDAVVVLPATASAQWDMLHNLQAQVRNGTVPRVLIVDGLDVRLGDWPDEYRHAALAALESILREGRARGLAVAASVGPSHRLPSGVREAFGAPLLLRHSTRSDLVQAGGSGELWRPHEPPGSGQWRGHRVQLVDAPPLPPESDAPPPELSLGDARLVAVVSRSPRADAATLSAAFRGIDPIVLEPSTDAAVRALLAAAPTDRTAHVVVVGDADAWAANWSLTALLREQATVVVHGGSREYRVFASGSTLPPLLDDPTTQCWVQTSAADARRARWPSTPATENVGKSRIQH